MSEKFKVHEEDKRLVITGPWELSVEVDYDDVWHTKVLRETRKLCAQLNKHWGQDAKPR
jgi:hypothetical protein